MPASRQTIMSSILIVVLLGAAAAITFWRMNAGRAPTNKDVTLYCHECQKTFNITHREFERRFELDQDFTLDPNTRTLRFRCDLCGRMTAESAGTADIPGEEIGPPGPSPDAP